MPQILIVCDDFRVGGIQRIALDQAYELNRRGISSEILVLSSEPNSSTASFQKSEKELIKTLDVQITYLSGSRTRQCIALNKLLKKEDYEYILGHSLRGSVLAWLLRLFMNYKPTIITTIHQLPSLSAPVQRVRRIFYSQFSDKLFIFSAIAKKDWNYRRKNNPLIWLISSKRKIVVCRNGVYLPRLPFPEGNFNSQDKILKRLVFIGRLTAWKGLGTFLDLAQMPQFKNIKVLLVTPSDPKEYLANLEKDLADRIICEVGKSISQIDFCAGDLHLYPANPGANSRFAEGVSINVLEMACLGVPSLITKGGAETWPELVDLGMIIEVDWSNLEAVAKIIEQDFIRPSITAIEQSRAIIDVGKNIHFLLRK
jgi:glycosyltransferase involved in cell wall biosynthesis